MEISVIRSSGLRGNHQKNAMGLMTIPGFFDGQTTGYSMDIS